MKCKHLNRGSDKDECVCVVVPNENETQKRFGGGNTYTKHKCCMLFYFCVYFRCGSQIMDTLCVCVVMPMDLFDESIV